MAGIEGAAITSENTKYFGCVSIRRYSMLSALGLGAFG